MQTFGGLKEQKIQFANKNPDLYWEGNSQLDASSLNKKIESSAYITGKEIL